MTAFQYNQIFGWYGGNKRTVDIATEMTPTAYTEFWNMTAENRQIAFNSFGWPVIEAMVTMQLDEILAPSDAKKRAAQPRIRAHYDSLIDLLSTKYSLPIKSADLYSGMMYFIELRSMTGNSRFLSITALIDNMNLLKPQNTQVTETVEVKQQLIRISSNGNVFYTDITSPPDLTKQQLTIRDFLFR